MKKLILAAFILYMPFQLKLPQLFSLNIVNIFLFLLLLVLFFGRDKVNIRSKFDTPLLIFLMIWVSSFIHSLLYIGIPVNEVLTEFKRLISLVLAYFVFSRCLNSKKEMRFLFYVFLLSVALVGIHTFRNGMIAGIHFADFKRSSGPFGEGWKGSDVAGGFLATFTPLLLGVLLMNKQKLFKIFSIFGIVFSILGLFATYSRGSMLALAASSIITILVASAVLFKKSKLFSVIIFAGFIVFVLGWKLWLPQTIINRAENTFQEEESTGQGVADLSTQKRIGAWKGGLEIFRKSPMFGVGFRIPLYIMSYDTHNAFILIAAEMGLIGLLVFLWFLWRALLQAGSILNTEFVDLGVGFVGLITSFLVVNMFYGNFFRDTVAGTFWVSLGLLVSAKKFSMEKVDPSLKRAKVLNDNFGSSSG